MKVTRVLFTLAFVITTLLVSAAAVSAQDGTWVSGITIQNQSETEEANVTVTFYWAEGTANAGQVAHSFTDVIPANQSKTYYVPSHAKTADLPEDFVGSAVVSSDQPVAANVNTQLPSNTGDNNPADPNRVGTSSGVLEPATKLYFTQLMKGYSGWNSYIAIQNTSAETASVTVKYYNDSDGAEVASQTADIHPYSTYIFRQAECEGLPAGWGGSAVVESAQLLAGVANFFNSGSSNATAQFHSYNAATAGATKLYVPRVVRNYYDYQGGIKVQNIGDAATDVTVTFYFGGNEYAKTITGLQPGASTVASSLYMPNVSELGTVAGSGAAVIESSSQPIVATVNEDNRLGSVYPGHEGRGVTYNAIADGAQTNTVLFPQVTAKYYGYSSGVQVQNVGTEETTVTAVFSMMGREDVVVTKTVAPMASADWFAPNVVPGENFNGSVVVTADQALVGISNFSSRTDIDTRYPTNYGDSFTTYNGINK